VRRTGFSAVRRATAVAFLILGLMGPACSEASSGGGTTELELQVSGDPEEIVVYRSLVNSFEKDNPDVDLRLTPVADKDDHLAKLTTSFAAGTPPDIFLVNFREYSQFVAREAVEPLDPHLEEVGLQLDRYYEPPVEAFTFEGALQCMPQNISSLVVYYNNDLLRKAGLKRPPADWDWEEFRSYALRLTDERNRGVGIEPSIIRLAPFVWSNGGEMVDDPDTPSHFTLEQPAAREALEFLVGLVRDDQVVPTEKEVVAAEDLETLFAAGRLGMLLSSRRDTPLFRENVELDWDVAALPRSKQPAGILHSDAYCIARGSDALDSALGFVAYATGKQGQTITALGGRTVPSLKSVANSGAFLDPSAPPRHSEVFLEGIPYIRRTPVIPTWPEIEDVAGEILTRAFYEDGYSVDDAVTDLDEKTASLFSEGTED
jgi:multiple sugar transport system substrate-binding protein